MRNNSEFENVEELLAGYVLGNLDEEELAWLNERLKDNPQLRKQIGKLETTLNLMPYSLGNDFPQTDLRTKILAKAQEKSLLTHNLDKIPSIDSKKGSDREYFILNRYLWIISVLTTLSTLWFGFNSYNLRQKLALRESLLQKKQDDLIALLHQPNNRLVSLRGFDDRTISGSLFIAPYKNKAILALQNLKPLSGKQVYRLWAISEQKTTGCVNFIPNKKGIVNLEFSDNALIDAHSIKITIEPKADTLKPKGTSIVIGSDSSIEKI